MSDVAQADPADSPAPQLLRARSGSQRVTNIELFFDLVYVFAITQLSHYLIGHATALGALQAGLLLVMVWLVWIYTTWVTNWLDPQQMAVRLLLVVLMLLGESIVIIGATLAGQKTVTASSLAGFVVAFVSSVTLWWLYFDQSAEAAAEKIARSDDPGRLGRSAYHLIHPVMVAGIIVTAAADDKVLSDPTAVASTASAWMILGGPALFLAGHAAFKLVVWHFISWPRLAGIAGLALLALASKAIPAVALAACATALVAAVAVTDRLRWLPRPAAPGPES